jgi:dTDP-4-dehydrorhamnose reductase
LKNLELWAGAECTVNRVGNDFISQLHETGHYFRDDDVSLFGEIGASAVRFPVLWELSSADQSKQWHWSDERLGALRRANIRPIIGLVHHGSGPAHTSLLSDDFGPGLAAHALAVAERYSWVEEWTPVNEPLTTARFSALYGHWYPHARDERSFWTALLNQIDAVRLSMRAIRSVIPHARLVQTEDLGRTYSTPPLAEQATFDNTRRWSGWDLLCGRVQEEHELWGRLCTLGLEDRLRVIADDPCPPDIIGINHYLTSDRFLDHRLSLYPEQCHGSNGSQAYADVEAIRVLSPPPQAFSGAIREAWERYKTPIALTEVHNGCTREEQLRWMLQAWDAATSSLADGIEVVAVTAWAVFGNQGWNTLLTGRGKYEEGAFDVRGGTPRPTALARLLKALGGPREAPAAALGDGWWSRDIRFHYPVVRRLRTMAEPVMPARPHRLAPILIVGATGTLGQALAAACHHRNLPFELTNRSQLDVQDQRSIEKAIEHYQPSAVINASGWVRVDEAEDDPQVCFQVNADGAGRLAATCAAAGLPSISFSSDLVFDGSQREYVESDQTAPLNVYGRSKCRMEETIAALSGRHLVVRTAAFFSPADEFNFARHVVQALARGEHFCASNDQAISPTYVPDLCNAVLDLVIDEEAGVWHLSNRSTLSWADFARMVAVQCGLDAGLVRDVSGDALRWRARRPAQCGLASERGGILPSLEDAVARFARNLPAFTEAAPNQDQRPPQQPTGRSARVA